MPRRRGSDAGLVAHDVADSIAERGAFELGHAGGEAAARDAANEPKEAEGRPVRA